MHDARTLRNGLEVVLVVSGQPPAAAAAFIRSQQHRQRLSFYYYCLISNTSRNGSTDVSSRLQLRPAVVQIAIRR